MTGMQRIATILIVTLVSISSIQAQQNVTLVASPVPGKLGFQPSANFASAIIVPSQSTAYLAGRVGGNSSSFATQVRTAMSSLNATMTALGSSMDAGVRTTVFLTDLDYFNDMNTIYRTYFTTVLPSRSTVEVPALAGGTMIEVDMIAYDGRFARMTASS